jgi:hypothetical protein
MAACLMNWIYFKNKETGGTFEAPDEDGVRARYEALGWVEVDRPEAKPFVPAPGNVEPGTDTEWVTLYHPEVKATHDFPNNAEAIAGAQESGWTAVPKKDTKPVQDDPPAEDTQPKKVTASAKAKTAEEK